ncbi:MAG: transcriptional regulator NrdR [bacterium]|nr:transcriptional regulator NrdR [bacterium]MDD5354275.1 transcriptional regulator NrdR [bacterium]MDD5757048.1 transcriptional regulator NrdR [bacterium]
MKCPFCGSLDDKVIDSRPLEEASIIRRRRECLACQKRFTTYERLEEVPLMVIKSDNRREPFSREKLRAGLLRACDKRPISIDKIEKIISEIEYEMHNYYIMEVHSSSIGQKVLKQLKELDEVAYIRFASVHRNFKDINTFMQELKKLKKEKDTLEVPGENEEGN